MLNVGGGDISWSPFEKRNTISHLYAMRHFFGLPGYFVTFSPSAANCPYVLRLALREVGIQSTSKELVLELSGLIKSARSRSPAARSDRRPESPRRGAAVPRRPPC